MIAQYGNYVSIKLLKKLPLANVVLAHLAQGCVMNTLMKLTYL